MAIENICAKLFKDLDSSCVAPVRGWYQQAVIFSLTDVDTSTVSLPDYTNNTCAYTVEFTVKCATKGYRISGIEAGTNFKGWFSKTRDANGYPTYNHQVQLFLAGIDADIHCALSSLDKGRYAVALQTKSGEIVIYGFGQGLATGDYDYDIVEGGGGAVITLTSLDTSPESLLPLIYKSGTTNGEIADFDSAFENSNACP